MKILVTGGAGFIGSHVCEALVSKGYSVVCVDNFDNYYSPDIKKRNIANLIKDKNFKLYTADIRDLKEMDNIFRKEKIDRIIHLAAKAGVRPSVENPFIYYDVNVKGTLNLLELSKKYGIKNFVFGSSSSVYGNNKKIPFSEKDKTNPISPYAATKKACEEICYCYHYLFNLNITCLRFFTVYGPRNRPDMAVYKFTRLINENKPITMYGNGTTRRDYTFIGDIVNGMISALEKNFCFEIINLGESRTVELKYLIELIEKNLGKKARIIKKPIPLGDVKITYADISKAKKMLSYEPKTKIEDGIKIFVDWFKRQELR